MIDRDPWAPYEPTIDEPWDLRKVGHLHRRAGFGATWAELQRDWKRGPDASIAALLDPPATSSDDAQILEGLRLGATSSGDLQRLKAYWLFRMRFGVAPLREKLTLFWHSHFATSNVKVDSVRAMGKQNERLRSLALGRFDALLNAMLADPAMLVWLDGGSSKKGKPNENLAREFLELFTLGPGPYTEADIREAARAFTGWVGNGDRMSFADADPGFVREASLHDAGSKTFLGQPGAWDAPDIVRITLQRPEVARTLARKLYRFFVDESAEPSQELIDPLASSLRSNGYSIEHAMGLILRSSHFFSKATERRKVKSPVEFSLGLVRMLEVPRPGLNLLAVAAACDRQGQALFAPPNVKGWDGGKTWIDSASLLERMNWATEVVWGNPDRGIPRFDPIAWANKQGVKPSQTGEAFVELLTQGGLAPEVKNLVLEAGRDGTADGLRKSLQRLLHCPEFQLC